MVGEARELLARLSVFSLKALNALIGDFRVGKMIERRNHNLPILGVDAGVPCLTVIQRMTARNGSIVFVMYRHCDS